MAERLQIFDSRERCGGRGNYLKCDADSGITNFETIPASEIDKWRHNSRYTILKKQDLTEILFRKKIATI